MSANTHFMEHRWGTRVQLDAPAELRAADGTELDIVVDNASLSGAFVHIPAQLPSLARVWVRPRDAAGGWIEACIVRNEPAGVGLEWLDPGAAAVNQLLALHEAGNRQGAVAVSSARRLKKLHPVAQHAET
ncbi:MAG TPA: PilZ domain-containing protein [Steroidobacteraceae bacterium]|nr:PilZ domain-containing protein [Steroidobacteraceae bacterium]